MNYRLSLMATAPLLAFAVSPAHSANICVNPNSASCSATIQDGIDAAAVGDSVSIAGGFYNENVTISTDGVTLRGGKGAVLDGDDPLSGVTVTVTSDDVTIKGFTIRNGQDYGLEISGDGATVRNMSISGPDSSCIYLSGNDATVSNNRIRGCGSEGIYATGADNLVIAGNTISQCDSSCIEVSGDGFVIERNNIHITEDSYLIDVSGDDGEVVNNKLKNSDSEAISGSGDNVLIHGNKIMNSQGAIDHSGANPVVTRNRGRYFHGDDGIDVSCNTDCSAAVFSNNRIEDIGDDSGGMIVNASAVGMVAMNNVVRRVEDVGIEVNGASSIMVSRNSVKTTGGDSGEECFEVNGTGAHVLEDNRAADCHGDGFNVSGTGHDIDGNKISDAIEDGIDLDGGTNVSITDNRIAGANGVGIDVETSTGTTVDGNRISSVRLGICDEATGSTVTNNTTRNADLPDQLNTAGACPID